MLRNWKKTTEQITR